MQTIKCIHYTEQRPPDGCREAGGHARQPKGALASPPGAGLGPDAAPLCYSQLSPPAKGRPAPEPTKLPGLSLRLLVYKVRRSRAHLHPQEHTQEHKGAALL